MTAQSNSDHGTAETAPAGSWEKLLYKFKSWALIAAAVWIFTAGAFAAAAPLNETLRLIFSTELNSSAYARMIFCAVSIFAVSGLAGFSLRRATAQPFWPALGRLIIIGAAAAAVIGILRFVLENLLNK